MRIFSTVIALIAKILSLAAADNWPLNDISSVSFRRAYEGEDVVLKCAGRVEEEPGLWKFKSCGIGLDKTICPDIDYKGSDAIWDVLPYNNSKLILKNVNNSLSGFYRCKQHATIKIYIFNTIQLEILAKFTDSNKLPQFLEGFPKNITLRKSSQAVFQCKVLSKPPVRIRWVWQGEGSDESFGSLRYLDQFYKVIGNGQQGHAGNTSLSKFDIPRVGASDTGRYLCVAINIWGYSTSSAYLNVIDDESKSENVSHFYILFLIPVGLAIIPLIMWICYIWCRRKRRTIIQSEENIDMPINYYLNNHILYQL